LARLDSHHHHQQDLKGKKLVLSIFLNIIITVSQVVGGLISGSLSLLSDALHNFSDVISLIISYIATVLTRKKETAGKTFGYKRAEILAAFINASTLIIVAILLAIEAIKRFQEPQEIASMWVIILAALSIILNGLSVWILQKDAKDNLNIKSAYIHLLSDMFTSVAVLIAGILMYYLQLWWIDGLLTLLIAVYLVYISWNILIGSLKVLMLFTPSQITIEQISNEVNKIPEVNNIHHVHVWQLDDKQIHFEAHVDLNEDFAMQKVNEILEKIRILLHDKFNIAHVTLQPEFNICEEKNLIEQG
jgi:cobalt-zinc-cadmium efflux system protein